MTTYRSIFKKDLFKGQVALVTGGGTGIGRCIAHELASLGATVVIAARKIDQLQAVQNEIQLLGGICDTMQINIRDAAMATKLIENIVIKHGKLDCLVNNAGGQFMSPASMLSSRGFATVVDLNLNGTFNMCKAAFDGYMGEHGGRIVNIVADTRNGIPRAMHTGAARAGIINMTKTLAVEWGPYNGIRINCVAPGLIVSSGMKNYNEDMVNMMAEASWMNPSSRFGTESEVSAAVAFLLSPAASYINGVNLEVDGASSLSKGNPEGDELKYNPDGSLHTAYIGWPEGADNVHGIRHVDAPVMVNELLNKYKKIRRSKI
ncbi:hypothetical protein BC939DRAFT_530500 [Gamsiella multidivaricata]|uniref:uncharacterized protein n=1 Tax=Gamsiella multidivaricata TaxID=101098 RepID=UPI0022206251|nr:uncharacterized protein BC939DRAFT_530500 [Gamsiella multidivaricata]KAG0369616.1 hypothetical protein BGZ54_009425 [Gamsiella multidivaricata]KAI7820689.1 hypothetical protein BC939DRAFT_530500 [Gamsiella multidivaricata]